MTTRSVGWSQLDYEEYPELKFPEGDNWSYPAQFIVGAGLTRRLDFQREGDESLEDAAMRFAYMVINLTGDWLNGITCDAIEELIESNSPAMVYFGTLDSLYGGEMDHLKRVVAHDKFTFTEQNIEVFFNTEKECAEKRNLNPEANTLVLYLHSSTMPFVLTSEFHNMEYEDIIDWISTSIVVHNNKWSQRAQFLLFDLRKAALIYLVNDLEELEDDWRA